MIKGNFSRHVSAYLLAKRTVVGGLLHVTNIQTVLDFGCGNGEAFCSFLARDFEGIDIFAFETDPNNVAELRKLGPKVKVVDNLEDLRRRNYDLILLTEVLEHVDQPQELLSFLISLLKHEGYLVLSVPNGNGASEWASTFMNVVRLTIPSVFRRGSNGDVFTHSNSPHINFFSLGDLRKIFSRVGIKVISAGNPVYMHFRFFRWLSDHFEWFRKINFSGIRKPPRIWADDWIFVLQKGKNSAAPLNADDVKTGNLVSIRRFINTRAAQS